MSSTNQDVFLRTIFRTNAISFRPHPLFYKLLLFSTNHQDEIPSKSVSQLIFHFYQ